MRLVVIVLEISCVITEMLDRVLRVTRKAPADEEMLNE